MKEIPRYTLFYYFLWNKSTAVHYFDLLNEIDHQPYIISALSVKYPRPRPQQYFHLAF